ncbi:MAG: hypothetical protein V3S47_06750 [Acidobacteriota bacterium]
MTRSSCGVVLVVVFWLVAPAFAAKEPTRNIDQLVDCFRAVEEVRWQHRTWPESNPGPKPALGEVLSETEIRARVQRTLRGAQALELYWNRPITGVQLQAEIDRMASETRRPERLAELWAALDNDPQQIAECLALPLLTDRLLHSHYAFDPRLHRDIRARAASALQSGDLDPARFKHGRYRRQTWVRTGSDSTSSNPTDDMIHVSPDAWSERLARLGELVSGTVTETSDALPLERFGPLQETEDAFYAVAVADQQDDRLTVVTVDWPKEPFETWWADASPGPVAETPYYDTTFSQTTINTTSCTENTWRSVRSLPDERDGHIAVWTGAEMLVWGGLLFTENPGGRYDPATDTWHPINSRNHPLSRVGATGVWTGTEMIVWGGWGGSQVGNVFDTGGRYDPQTDDWTPTTTVGTPAARTRHTAVWSGSEMIVWGGCTNGTCFGVLLATGGHYDPSTDTWSATSLTGAPTARSQHTAVWSDGEMIVWGGDAGSFSSSVTNTGARYDPSTDSWTATGTSNAPAARDLHQAVWTGSEMLVWGGCEAPGCFVPLTISGGRYNPVTDAWQPTSNVNAPAGRRFHTALWTGSEMIVWGGCVDHDCSAHGATGGRYDPGTDTWTATATSGAPQARSQHTAVWSGSEMIVWGGCFSGECQIETNTGGRYDPVSDSWVATSMETGPSARLSHTAVWTGSEMIVWGGWGGFLQNSGKRYDPATDSWSAVQSFGVPFARDNHTAVWTGSEMIVWGGSVAGMGAHNSGGRYDPVTDSWTATSFTGAPSNRLVHTAVWTGSEMIVWGGCSSGSCNSFAGTGGRYSPATDSWLATLTAGAPIGRSFHNATWTGSEMIVWGGRSKNGPEATGGRYAPATDVWSAVGTSGAPSARQSHVGVWSGSQMVVWGGRNDSVRLNDGGRYDPSTDVWTPTSATGAPDPRYNFTGIWTGDDMIVWGGSADLSGSDDHFTGGRYDPVADAWTATGTDASTPFGRAMHTAVWTGGEMIVWGGWRTNGSQTNTGAVYCVNGATAGGIPGGVGGLQVTKNGGQLDLVWNPSCSVDASDYSVYEGTLGDWTSHMPVMCATGGAVSIPVNPASGSVYFLIAPRNTTVEGSYGTDSEGFDRTTSLAACMAVQDTTTCP